MDSHKRIENSSFVVFLWGSSFSGFAIGTLLLMLNNFGDAFLGVLTIHNGVSSILLAVQLVVMILTFLFLVKKDWKMRKVLRVFSVICSLGVIGGTLWIVFSLPTNHDLFYGKYWIGASAVLSLLLGFCDNKNKE